MYSQNRHCAYRRNIEARSRNHCCSGQAINVTCSECVFVALAVQHAECMRPCYIVVCGLPGCTVFFFPHYLINGTILEENVIGYKICGNKMPTRFNC